jgi:UDP-N-acetylmuramoylalanine--D-glutamate ligase
VAEAQKQQIPIISEIELASWYITVPVVAVTGTNGKTTTTLLIGDMMRRVGRHVFVGGNVGNPLIDLVHGKKEADLVVVELSSFQLESIERFRPAIGILLNLTEDHLDRYRRFEDYVCAKSRLFMNQGASDVSILNAKDPAVQKAAFSSGARKLYFNVEPNSAEGAYFDGSFIEVKGPKGKEIYDPRESRLAGIHNIENMMAAIMAARLCGCPMGRVQETLEAFQPIPHRLEFVRELGGVRYFNDSKGTNVGAVVKSLQSFRDPIVLIAGGRDKGGTYAPLKEPILERVKHLILIGEARKRITRELSGTVEITEADSLESAVKQAHASAEPGDVVLLSPACASYDMFRDYTERGDIFKAAVGRLVDPPQGERPMPN